MVERLIKIKALFIAFCIPFCILTAGTAASAERAKATLPAAPVIVVEGVQMPAWVEHASGARDPLVIGARLLDSDRIYTGPGSRALLRLADGSQIKLGENGILALADLGNKKVQMKDVVTASLDVVKGA